MGQIIVRGSIGDIMYQQNVPFELAVLNCQYLVLVDTSASMSARTQSLNTRYEAAREQLKRLQNSLPGKVLLASFSNTFKLCPNGIPEEPSGGTELAVAFQEIMEASLHELVEKIIVISDGQPNAPQRALEWANKIRRVCPIESIFIGDEGDEGYFFMQKLSSGKSFAVDANDLGQPLKLLTSGQ